MVDAADAERRRIERDLHDGAQQQLVSLAMNLGRAKAKLDTDPDGARELVAQAHQEAKDSIIELRNVVRGVHPAVLTDRGLDAALSALAARSPVPVRLDVDVRKRPSPPSRRSPTSSSASPSPTSPGTRGRPAPTYTSNATATGCSCPSPTTAAAAPPRVPAVAWRGCGTGWPRSTGRFGCGPRPPAGQPSPPVTTDATSSLPASTGPGSPRPDRGVRTSLRILAVGLALLGVGWCALALAGLLAGRRSTALRRTTACARFTSTLGSSPSRSSERRVRGLCR